MTKLEYIWIDGTEDAPQLRSKTKVVGEFADSQRRLTDVGFGLGTSILNTTEAISSFRVPLSELERIASTNGVTLDYLNDATGLTIENMKK